MPAIVGGHEVYETWKETLSFWLSSGNNEVYMATPFLEQDYLKKILDIVCTRKTTAKIGKIFVRKECENNSGLTFYDMLETMIVNYNPEEQKLLCKQVHSKAHVITTKPENFHAKFIGCINMENEKAEVLLTSAYFTSDQNYKSITYHDMSADDFRRFIEPMTKLEKHPTPDQPFFIN